MEKPIVPNPERKGRETKPEEGESDGMVHLAHLGGLGLLAELSEFGEHLSETTFSRTASKEIKAIDPRDKIEPRRKFVPK